MLVEKALYESARRFNAVHRRYNPFSQDKLQPDRIINQPYDRVFITGDSFDGSLYIDISVDLYKIHFIRGANDL